MVEEDVEDCERLSDEELADNEKSGLDYI